MSYSRWPPRLSLPRTADRFALVSYARLRVQTANHSRTAPLSGASPDFATPNPLSRWLLIAMFSTRFHEFQALRALVGSDTPDALAGNYTFVLPARQRTSRCDPCHPSCSCEHPFTRFDSVLCVPVAYDACASRAHPAGLRAGFSSCVWVVSPTQVACRRQALLHLA